MGHIFAQIYWHDDYTNGELWRRKYDIGLLKLQTPLKSTPTATLYKSITSAALDQCVAIGGGTDRFGHNANRLQKAKMPVRSDTECRALLKQHQNEDFDSTYQLCAKDPSCSKGNCPDTCAGDSGGPLICPYRQNFQQYALIAVFSIGFRPCGGTRPNFCVKVEPFVDWLDQHARNLRSKPIDWV